MIQEDGYLCLSNFGVAKKLEDPEEVAQSYFGDLDYQSPEMLLEEGHSYPTDWWSVGILTYQFVVGIPPFYDANLQKQGEKIVNGDIYFPEKLEISEECKDFISHLLEKEPKDRLGTKSGLNDIL